MPWARLDDKFHSHPSTLMAGMEANGLFARGLSYAADHLTDGYLPNEWLATQCPTAARTRILNRLVETGLFEALDNGYRIVDYLVYNPSREKVLAEREKRAAAGRRGAESKWDRVRNA